MLIGISKAHFNNRTQNQANKDSPQNLQRVGGAILVVTEGALVEVDTSSTTDFGGAITTPQLLHSRSLDLTAKGRALSGQSCHSLNTTEVASRTTKIDGGWPLASLRHMSAIAIRRTSQLALAHLRAWAPWCTPHKLLR